MITKTPDLSKKRLANISLSYRCIQVVLGGLLGDSSLKNQKGYKNARLQITHSIVQEEYLLWKAELLQEIATARVQTQKPDAYSKNKKIAFMSRALPELSKIHEVVYKNNMLRIQRKWLNHLKPLALLIWWLDDGSIVGNGRKGVLCTDSFDYHAHEILRRYLMVVWDIHTSIGNVFPQKASQQHLPEKQHVSSSVVERLEHNVSMIVEHNNEVSTNKKKQLFTKAVYHRLYLNNQECRKLFELIMPFLETPSMIKKFALRYNDSELQQRWISKMKSAMPKFHKEIDSLY